MIDENFNSNEIYFTKVNIGKIKQDKLINMIVMGSINYINNKTTIYVSMYGSKNNSTSTIKNIYNVNIFLNKQNIYIYYQKMN